MGNYGSLSLGASGNVTFSGTLTPSGSTYNLGGGGGTLTFTPTITVAASLNVSGPAAVVLTSVETYSGSTTISGGTLQVGSGAAGGPGSINGTSGVLDNGFLAFDSSTTITTFAHNISGSGGVGQMSTARHSASKALTPTPVRRSSAPARSRRARGRVWGAAQHDILGGCQRRGLLGGRQPDGRLAG